MRALISFDFQTLSSIVVLLCALVASIYALVAVEHLAGKLLAMIGAMLSIFLISILVSSLEGEK